MTRRIVGVSISADDARSGLEQIVQAEALGVPAAWMTSGGGAETL